MKKTPAAPAGRTHARILAAAARMFARNGLAGATTRAIARAAGVNEVTIFRHFKTKERLLAAVVGANFGPSTRAATRPRPAVTADLRADLTRLGRDYDRLLTKNLPLVRTMLGEIHHHRRDHEQQVFRAVFRPLKAALAGRIEASQPAGELGADLPAALLADLLTGMLFTGVLRRASRDFRPEYPADAYRQAAVGLVLRGAAVARKGGLP